MDETYNVHQSTDVASYIDGPHAVSDPYGLCNADGTPTAAGVAAGNDPLWPLNCADPKDPVYKTVGVGSNGFPGYSPAFSDEYQRDSFAVYGEVSTDVTDNFFVQAALRFEDYSDFGNETVSKIAARYRLSDSVNLRGSIGTGFRAPTPGQQGTCLLYTSPSPRD